jgi:hypothetical protein
MEKIEICLHCDSDNIELRKNDWPPLQWCNDCQNWTETYFIDAIANQFRVCKVNKN